MAKRTWLVPSDFSPSADAALEEAANELTDLGGGTIRLFHAFAVPYVPVTVPGAATDAGLPSSFELARLVEKELMEALEKVKTEATARWPRVQFEIEVARGAPYEAILAEAESRGVDRIVMGSHGRTGLSHVLLGSVASRVARLSPVPVLVVKAPPGAEGQAA